jgi:hypothetical protein
MSRPRQISARLRLILLVGLCAVPSCFEGFAVAWGEFHGKTGMALRDGLDFWAGGFLALHQHLLLLFDHIAYQNFLAGLYGKLPYHFWSYPPNYLLLTTAFDWLAPWHAVLAFDLVSLLLLVAILRLAGKSWWLIAAVVAAPASLENFLEGQNGALMAALIAGGVLLTATRPRLAGGLIGLASIKPQLGLALPLYLLRRHPAAFAYAALAAIGLAAASLYSFGAATWQNFIHVTGPAMTNVLLTGQPPTFAAGLVSIFATFRFLGVPAAIAIQGAATIAVIVIAARAKSPVQVIICTALASPYLHLYDLLGVSIAVALLVQDRLRTGFAPGEAILFFLVWFAPGLLPWMPAYAHATPLLLILLLASA